MQQIRTTTLVDLTCQHCIGAVKWSRTTWPLEGPQPWKLKHDNSRTSGMLQRSRMSCKKGQFSTRLLCTTHLEVCLQTQMLPNSPECNCYPLRTGTCTIRNTPGSNVITTSCSEVNTQETTHAMVIEGEHQRQRKCMFANDLGVRQKRTTHFLLLILIWLKLKRDLMVIITKFKLCWGSSLKRERLCTTTLRLLTSSWQPTPM